MSGVMSGSSSRLPGRLHTGEVVAVVAACAIVAFKWAIADKTPDLGISALLGSSMALGALHVGQTGRDAPSAFPGSESKALPLPAIAVAAWGVLFAGYGLILLPLFAYIYRNHKNNAQLRAEAPRNLFSAQEAVVAEKPLKPKATPKAKTKPLQTAPKPAVVAVSAPAIEVPTIPHVAMIPPAAPAMLGLSSVVEASSRPYDAFGAGAGSSGFDEALALLRDPAEGR